MSIQSSGPNGGAPSETRSASRAAWDGNPPHAEAARQRLLEAAGRCIARDGIADTTVAAIAAEAGVSRQTVYRYFAGRDEIAGRTLLHAAEKLREQIGHAIARLSEPGDMVVETLVLGVTGIRSDPVLRAIADPSRLDGFFLSRITRRPGIEWVRSALAPVIEAAGWSGAEVEEKLELILRIFLSLIVSPAPERDAEALRTFLYRHFVPGLGLT